MSVRRLSLTIPAVLVALVAFLLLPIRPALASTGYALVKSFGPPSGFIGPEGLGPRGLAVDNSTGLGPDKGDVYVTDPGNHVVDEFSASGVLLAEASVSGVLLAQMAVDDAAGPREGDVYVAGASNGVIYRFSPGLGSMEEVITGLEEPTDVTVDEAGNLFVLKSAEGSGGQKVLEFNSEGSRSIPAGPWSVLARTRLSKDSSKDSTVCMR